MKGLVMDYITPEKTFTVLCISEEYRGLVTVMHEDKTVSFMKADQLVFSEQLEIHPALARARMMIGFNDIQILAGKYLKDESDKVSQ